MCNNYSKFFVKLTSINYESTLKLSRTNLYVACPSPEYVSLYLFPVPIFPFNK